MKRIQRPLATLGWSLLLLVDLVFICTFELQAQQGWFPQQSPIQNINLSDVAFINSLVGVAVGAGGTILGTTDGGTSWNLQQSGTSNDLKSIIMVDAATAVAVGERGTILRTNDNGRTWVAQFSGVEHLLNAVYFTSVDTGVVVGLYGIILRTTNGGLDWMRLDAGSTSSFYAVSFSDASTGTIVGMSGTIIRTTDGGQTWVQQTSGTSYHLYDILATDAASATVVGQSAIILRTTNRGTTWEPQSNLATTDLHSVSFANAVTGIAVGASGTILRTTNAGTTWNFQPSGEARNFSGVSCVDTAIGTVVGIDGMILHTTDGGRIPIGISDTAAMPPDQFDQLSTFVRTTTGEQYHGRVLFADDSMLVLWQSTTPYHWLTLQQYAMVLHVSEIDRITFEREDKFWSKTFNNTMGGVTIGAILGVGIQCMRIGGHDKPDYRSAISATELISIMMVSVGTITGVFGALGAAAEDMDEHHSIKGQSSLYHQLLPILQKRALLSIRPSVELKFFMKRRQ